LIRHERTAIDASVYVDVLDTDAAQKGSKIAAEIHFTAPVLLPVETLFDD
jgi:hypothetical protein